MREARTLTGEALKRAEVREVITLVREWDHNDHFAHNTIEVLLYMVDAMDDALNTIKQLEAKIGL